MSPRALPPSIDLQVRKFQDQVEDDLRREVAYWRGEAGMWRSKHEHLQQIYNKLADQWNVFQATARPDNRNIQRAEGAGEMARKLAEALLAIAYDKDARELLTDLLLKLNVEQGKPAGQEVEVGNLARDALVLPEKP